MASSKTSKVKDSISQGLLTRRDVGFLVKHNNRSEAIACKFAYLKSVLRQRIQHIEPFRLKSYLAETEIKPQQLQRSPRLPKSTPDCINLSEIVSVHECNVRRNTKEVASRDLSDTLVTVDIAATSSIAEFGRMPAQSLNFASPLCCFFFPSLLSSIIFKTS